MRRAHPSLFLVVALALATLTGSAEAQQVVQQQVVQQDPPSIFESGYQGMLSGAAVGASAGYLVGRRDGWKKSDWRALGLGLGIGTLAGAGLGLTLGIMDRTGVPAGHYIARDLLAGAGFGAVIGVISGGIAAAVSGHGERILFGTAIVTVAGAGAGIITGIIEGATKRRGTASRPTYGRVKITPSFSADARSFAPGVVGRF